MRRLVSVSAVVAICFMLLTLWGCSNGGGEGGGTPIAATQSAYIIVAWNDLGMHCLNPTYDNAVILPPYNTVWAQVIQRGNPPKILTSGVMVEYSIEGNTYSYGKIHSSPSGTANYGQFWDNMLQLFGVSLPHDKGLNLDNPAINNGLSGTMVMKTDHFQVNGIPVTPVGDDGTWNPFQVAVITAKTVSGTVLATTRTTVPTSDEINCAKCHGTANPLLDILQKHDLLSGTTLTASKPVLCAAVCHGSPALGIPLGTTGKYLSQAIHTFHSTQGALCYDCHPGATTSCNRSVRHTAPDGNCITCHGDLATVGGSIATGRVPWVSEPKCVTCHNSGVAGVDTGAVLYRNDPGHGGIYCAGCHGSPHAMVPSSLASDNYQVMQYQGVAKSLGDCGVCHPTSRGGGDATAFAGQHAAEGTISACNVCHTGFLNAANVTNWPHQFQWKAR